MCLLINPKLHLNDTCRTSQNVLNFQGRKPKQTRLLHVYTSLRLIPRKLYAQLKAYYHSTITCFITQFTKKPVFTQLILNADDKGFQSRKGTVHGQNRVILSGNCFQISSRRQEITVNALQLSAVERVQKRQAERSKSNNLPYVPFHVGIAITWHPPLTTVSAILCTRFALCYKLSF